MIFPIKKMRVLLVGESQDEFLPTIKALTDLALEFHTQYFNSLHDIKNSLLSQNWDLIITLEVLPSFSGLDVLEVVDLTQPHLPVIFQIDSMEEELVVDLVRSGVYDFVIRNKPHRIRQVVERIFQERVEAHEENLAKELAQEALAAKEQMLAIVSHDIKNPLSAIQLEAQMLLRAVDRSVKSLLSEEVKIQAGRILKTTERMKILISDLLDKNKSENSLAHLFKSTVEPGRLILDVVDATRPLLSEKNISLHTNLEESVFLSLDRNKMYQVFSNLLNNAIKFTPQDGGISISMEECKHEYLFSVEDSGPGLKDMELQKVFEKYWTGKSTDCAGTGLGLFICKTIIEAHGGHIFVENSPGKGARFRFTLPKIKTDFNEKSFSYFDSQKDDRKKVYIIDDDEDLREVMSWALGKEGYSVHSFHSPSEALDCLMKGRHRPNLIVVDFHMDEMKGSEFVIKKDQIFEAHDCPVVMISATPREVEMNLPPHLYRNVITKPIDLEGLVDNVKRFLT